MRILVEIVSGFLKNHDFMQVNSTVAVKYNKQKEDDGHLRFPIRTILATVDLRHLDTAYTNVYSPYKCMGKQIWPWR